MAAETTSGSSRVDRQDLFKEAGATALVAFALAFSLVGFKTQDVPGGLAIVTRFDDVLVATFLAFMGRVALVLLRQGRPVPVLVTALPVTAILLVGLFSEALFGAETATVLERVLPFGAPVVDWTITVLVAVLAGRAALAHRRARATITAEEREAAMDRVGAGVQRVERVLGPVLIAFAVILPLLPMADRRILDIAILVVTYIMLGWGLNIVVGLAGLLDLGYVAFYAVGAYSYALLAQYYDLGFWVCLPFAGVMAASAGIILGFPVLRLRGDYLAIVTLGFGEMIRIILLNWYKFTKGPDGLSGIPRPTFFGLPFKRNPAEGVETFHSFFNLTFAPIDRIIFLYYVILLMALATNLFTLRIRKLPVGRAWEALARGRDRLPIARHQPTQHQAHGVCHRRHVRRLRGVVLRPPARASSAPRALPSSNPR